MADVRSAAGAATTGVFTGPVGNQVGTPIYINTSNGDISFLLPGDIIYTVSNGMQNLIAAMVFGNHLVNQPQDVANANQLNAVRALSTHPSSQPKDVGDANVHLSNRALDRQFFAQPPVANTLAELGGQIFATHLKPVPPDEVNAHLAIRALDRQSQGAIIGDANDLIRMMAFAPRSYFAPMGFAATTILENRTMRTAQLPAMWT